MAARIVGYSPSGQPIYEDPVTGEYVFEKPPEPQGTEPVAQAFAAQNKEVVSPIPAPAQNPMNTNEQMIDRLLESIIGTQFPQRMDSLTGAIPGYQAMASGSPMAVSQQMAPEFANLQRQTQQALKAPSMKFGPSGGGMLTLGKTAGLLPIQQQAASMPGKVRAQGRQGLLDMATNTSILNPSASRSGTGTSSMTREQPFDYTGFNMLGQGLGMLAGSPLGQSAFSWQSPTNVMPSQVTQSSMAMPMSNDYSWQMTTPPPQTAMFPY